MNIVSRLHDTFLTEAQASPMLISDLASMEKYISESYSGRSLIELLQNSDDAGSDSFLIKKLSDKCFLVANDGRAFDEADLTALCRSGASTKKRKGNTIGFRGIGFKSVVNFAKTVYLFSGDIKAVFSKQLASEELKDIENVPLIRIPYCFSQTPYDNLIQEYSEKYNTFLVFESYSNELENEVNAFDFSCMIFLQNVHNITFEINGTTDILCTNMTDIGNDYRIVKCINKSESVRWLVYSSMKYKPCCVAFKLDDTQYKIIPASKNESIIHSFMPTNDSISFPIKINGDFSTDPSRTKVIVDSETDEAVNNIITILSSITIGLINAGSDPYGIIKILSMGEIDSLSALKGKTVSDRIVEGTYNTILSNITLNGTKTYIQENGISDSDFELAIDTMKCNGVGEKEEENVPALISLYQKLGIKTIPTIDWLHIAQDHILSQSSRIQIIADIIHDSRFGISEDIINPFRTAILFDYENGIKPLSQQDATDVLNELFQGSLVERVGSLSDLEWFAKQFGIVLHSEQKEKKTINTPNAVKCTNKEIKKWRSVEENFVSFITSFPDVKSALDVAKKNLGYDVDVIMNDNSHQYYEIKSVSYMGESFSMTNNEFSSAIQYKDRFNLAIVEQTDDSFDVCIINDPANALNMTKRVTRWEWFCNSYSGEKYSSLIEY